jgi:hypothetical protein
MDVSAVRVIFMSLAVLTVPHMLLTAAAARKAGAGPAP